jgi:UDP-glucose 4-epimerase
MRVFVVGSCGYVASVTVERLIEKGHEVIGIDNFQSSYPEAINKDSIFYTGDYGDVDLLDSIFKQHKPEAVIHMAAESVIGISWTEPEKFFCDNVINGFDLLEVMRNNDVRNIVFSSTASSFGEPIYTPIDEKHPQNPINSYGESKVMFEKMLKWYGIAHEFKYNIFRYFNVGGATKMNGERRIYETRLVPTILRRISHNLPIEIFGTDWDTKDGTCIRDYVHVSDIADAHILALEDLNNHPTEDYNLGSGTGFSVMEICQKMEKIMGKKFEYNFVERRKGDPKILVASNEKAKKILGWNPIKSDLDTILTSSYEWYKNYESI